MVSAGGAFNFYCGAAGQIRDRSFIRRMYYRRVRDGDGVLVRVPEGVRDLE